MYQIGFLLYGFLAGTFLGSAIREREVAKERYLLRKIPERCPLCGSKINHIPAGISKKTGNHYQEFWACENPECSFSINKYGGIYRCSWLKSQKVKGQKTENNNLEGENEIDVEKIPF